MYRILITEEGTAVIIKGVCALSELISIIKEAFPEARPEDIQIEVAKENGSEVPLKEMDADDMYDFMVPYMKITYNPD